MKHLEAVRGIETPIARLRLRAEEYAGAPRNMTSAGARNVEALAGRAGCESLLPRRNGLEHRQLDPDPHSHCDPPEAMKKRILKILKWIHVDPHETVEDVK